MGQRQEELRLNYIDGNLITLGWLDARNTYSDSIQKDARQTTRHILNSWSVCRVLARDCYKLCSFLYTVQPILVDKSVVNGGHLLDVNPHALDFSRRYALEVWRQVS